MCRLHGQQQCVGLVDGLVLLELFDQGIWLGGVAAAEDRSRVRVDESDLVVTVARAPEISAVAIVDQREDAAAGRLFAREVRSNDLCRSEYHRGHIVGSLKKERPIRCASLGFDVAHKAKSGCYASSDHPTIPIFGRRLARRKIPELWPAIVENSHPPLFIVNGLCAS
jgi:hypothetical protein